MTTTIPATELEIVTRYLAQFTGIRSTLLRDGMTGPKLAISNVHRVWLDGVEHVQWTNGFGHDQWSRVEDGWVDVSTECVTHTVRIDQRPDYFMGCYTGNSRNTAYCTGCGWESDETFSGFMANRWAVEHEQANPAVTR
ncbi:hypothetical protein [Kutzneria albida]|uniref:Uncharacterized protein n=1 Tax=Kutzneria albida DSM 43870 TaxID=1449976 RepID=W5WJ98_9PSEU|nr:hypothetical protein [Kutzneria albida]AHH98234.1 hypothetical protein KALB_4872 [Kutzneria albida DSM 43870]